jgi:hypothetical protein
VHCSPKAGPAEHGYFIRVLFSTGGNEEMSLGKYLSAVRDLTGEIRDSFSEGERDDLFALLRDMGAKRWESWKDEHRGTIVRYVMSTPAERGKLKAFQANRLMLTFAAYQHILGAQVFLRSIESNQIYPGGGHRQMAGLAGTAYLEVLECADADRWPWGEDHPLFPPVPDQKCAAVELGGAAPSIGQEHSR